VTVKETAASEVQSITHRRAHHVADGRCHGHTNRLTAHFHCRTKTCLHYEHNMVKAPQSRPTKPQ